MHFNEKDDPLPKRVAVGLQKLSLALKAQSWQGAEALGLTPTQGQILALLKKYGALRLGDVAQSIGVKASTASESVRVLVEKGLIQKQKASDDARAVALELTEQGKREASKTEGWPNFLLGAIGTLSTNEQEGLWLGLMKVMHALQAQEQIPTVRMCVSCEHFRPNEGTGATPHQCAKLSVNFPTRQIKLECNLHQPLAKEEQIKRWSQFSGKL